ncbi:flavodoxin domain-containing protein [Thiomicrospira microaerophila]|uniref:flavodoxin domain-containing protein n=1 Tax=Thiomicrospira microaerophila TaxID=406020 RepID=UPI0006990CEF|nr:flavodoxin domain-containing protein [Thiomicrospira microaerophila]
MLSSYWQTFRDLIGLKSAPSELEIQMQNTDWVVLYATQSGRAKKLAEQTVSQLIQANQTVTLTSLAQIQPTSLLGVRQALIIVSTFGDGRAPDHAVGFSRKMKKSNLDLSRLRFSLLALGNTDYDVFCAFGHSLNQWLIDNQARSIFDMITVDKMAKDSLQKWQNQIHSAV